MCSNAVRGRDTDFALWTRLTWGSVSQLGHPHGTGIEKEPLGASACFGCQHNWGIFRLHQ